MQLHVGTVHKTITTQSQSPSRVKIDPPKLISGSDQETWEHFLRNFTMYKTAMKITDNDTSIHLIG